MYIQYNVGDCVYFDLSFTTPFGIGRIEEFRKDLDGSVLVQVTLYLRNSDIDDIISEGYKENNLANTFDENSDFHNLSEKQKLHLKQRELFCSQKRKIMPATLIKGKCSVTFLNDAESLLNYTNKEDTFFYSVTVFPRFLVGRTEIRIGEDFQAAIPPLLSRTDSKRYEDNPCRADTLIWNPENGITEAEIDEFLRNTRLVVAMGRAMACPAASGIRDLTTCAAAASRDSVSFHAMALLERHNYSLHSAERALLVSPDVADETDGWSTSESKLFELGYRLHKKDFARIRLSFLPWKSLQEIVAYYYIWKTTDDYVKNQECKIDSITSIKLFQSVYSAQVIDNFVHYSYLSCRSCKTPLQKYGVSLADSSFNEYHLCNPCWLRWKKYG